MLRQQGRACADEPNFHVQEEIDSCTQAKATTVQAKLRKKNVFTFGGAKRSGSDRECKYFPIGMNAREPLWR